MLFYVNLQAQFLDGKPPTDFELSVNQASDIKTLMKLARQAKSSEDYSGLQEVMEKVVKIKPHVPVLQYQLAEAYSLNGEKSKAFNSLIALQKLGLYFDLENNKNFDNISVHNVFNYIKENMDANGKHFGGGVESFNIDKSFSGLLFESIAFDSNSQAFLMGSIRDGRVIKISASNGEISTLINPADGGVDGPWATLDIETDEANDVLWVASSAISQFGKVNGKSAGLSGIFKYQLSTGKLLNSYPVPGNKKPTLFKDIHLTSKGDLYILGVINGVVLKLAKGSDQIALAFTAKTHKNLRSITSDETGDILYISDAEDGIVVVDTVQQKNGLFRNSEALSLVGISDLIFDDNGLIMIQNGFKPERVMRLVLNEDKVSIKTVVPIESSHPLFKSPSYGVVIGEGLYYIANSQSPKTTIYGGLLKGQQWENMAVLSTAKHYEEKASLNYQKQIEVKKQGLKGKK